MKSFICPSLMGLSLAASTVVAIAQGTAFTYQGRLNDGATPANGTYELRFTIYDSGSPAALVVAGPLTNSPTTVSNGLFAVALDFGNVFPGADRWLEIGVRSNASQAFAVLAPRQQVTATPYALSAGSALASVNAAFASYVGSIASNQIPGSAVTSTVANATAAVAAATATNLVSGARATNFNIWAGQTRFEFTNSAPTVYELNIYPSNSHDVVQINYAPGSAQNMILRFIGDHDGQGHPELLLVSQGSIALGAGSSQGIGNFTDERRLQLGVGGTHHEYAEWLSELIPIRDNPNLTMSMPQLFRALYWTNGDWKALGWASTPGSYPEPALALVATDTNGNGAFRFFDYFNYSVSDGVNWDANQPRFDILVGPTSGGISYRGKEVRERRTAKVSGSTYALDWNKAALEDITFITEGPVMLTTTGEYGGTTNFERRVFYLRSSGLNTALTYPIWNTSGALPATLLPNQLLRLELEKVGAGETNVQVVGAQVLADNTFVWDSDATNFFNRASVTNAAEKAAVNALVIALKASSLWARFDCIYPFVGGTLSSAGKNLVTNAFNVSWTANPTVSPGGVSFNGNTQFGDTGFTPSTAGGHFTQNSFSFGVYVTAAANWADGTAIMGAVNNTYCILDKAFGLLSGRAETGTDIALDVGGVFKGPCVIARTGLTTSGIGSNGGYAVDSTASAAFENANFYLGAENNGGLYLPANVTLGLAWISGGISSSDWMTLREIITEFESRLGR